MQEVKGPIRFNLLAVHFQQNNSVFLSQQISISIIGHFSGQPNPTKVPGIACGNGRTRESHLRHYENSKPNVKEKTTLCLKECSTRVLLYEYHLCRQGLRVKSSTPQPQVVRVREPQGRPPGRPRANRTCGTQAQAHRFVPSPPVGTPRLARGRSRCVVAGESPSRGAACYCWPGIRFVRLRGAGEIGHNGVGALLLRQS